MRKSQNCEIKSCSCLFNIFYFCGGKKKNCEMELIRNEINQDSAQLSFRLENERYRPKLTKQSINLAKKSQLLF